MNFFDTAIGDQSGTSEQYVGRALRDFAKREDVAAAAKFLPRTEAEIASGISGQQDSEIIRRAAELADRHGVTMTEVSLAWLLTKATAPVAGAAKLCRLEGAAKSVDLALTGEELAYIEESYVPHALVGVMAQNTASAAEAPHMWSTGSQEIPLLSCRSD